MIIFVIFLWFSFLFVTFKGEWNFTFFTDMDSGILRNDFLILSFSLSALALLYGSLRGCKVWQYGLWSFQTGNTKLDFCLRINIPQKKLLNFVFWINGELSKSVKIWLSKSIFYVKIIRIFLSFFIEEYQLRSTFLLFIFFDNINFKITLLLKLCPSFDSSPYTNSQNSIISFGYVDS